MQSDICHLPMHYFSWFLYWWICLCICVQRNLRISQSSMGNVGHKLCILQSSSSHDETLIMFNHFSQLYLCGYLQGASCHHLHLNNHCHFISANCICVFVYLYIYIFVYLCICICVFMFVYLFLFICVFAFVYMCLGLFSLELRNLSQHIIVSRSVNVFYSWAPNFP